jgi:hypothetical protein
MIWRGEGYGINYYPKTKSKNNRVGIFVDHTKLKHFVNDNLKASKLKVSCVPYRKNIYKKMDEINRFSDIVTDDMLTTHLAVYLRKRVHYLETIPSNVNFEFFGNGRIYKVPLSIFK